jgi:death-on-curing protein
MIHLSKRFVVAYHARLIDVFGGSSGVRDEALLDSALAQPQATFDGTPLHADLWEAAAAYGFHLIRNHAFVDGNKRIAAVATGAFLEVNGAPLRVDEVELYQAMITLAEGRLAKAALAEWLRAQAPLR